MRWFGIWQRFYSLFINPLALLHEFSYFLACSSRFNRFVVSQIFINLIIKLIQ